MRILAGCDINYIVVKKMEHRTKKQHYIAQSIIKVFIENNELFEKTVDNKKTYKTSVGNSMCHNNSYEYILFKDNALENYFANTVDSMTATALKKILKLIEKEEFDIKEVYKEVCKNLEYFIINYYKSISSLVRMSVKADKIDQYSSITQMLTRIFDKKYILKLISIIMMGYKFAVIKSKTGDFIMCDQYIATCSTSYKGQFVNISSRDIGIKDTIILIPFNSHYYGIFYNGETKKLNLDNKIINVLDDDKEKMINQVIYDNATFKVLGRNKGELEKIEKANNISGDITAAAIFSDHTTTTYKVKKEVFLDKEEYEFYQYWKMYEWAKMKNIRRNDKCKCGSGLKYKKCCKEKVEKSIQIMNTMHNNQKDILIVKKLGIEEPVLMPASKNKEINEMIKNLKKDNDLKLDIFNQ